MPLKWLFSLLLWAHSLYAQITIMIDPAGDAKRTGRTIGSTFERAMTLELAQALQKELMQSNHSVIITRSAGELVQPMQNARFANRLPIDLYLTINCAQTSGAASLHVYQLSYGEPFITPPSSLSFVSMDAAHHGLFADTSRIAEQLVRSLQQSHAKQFHTQGPYRIPIAPLVGIKAPALSIELLLSEQHDWRSLVTPLAHALTEVISQ